MLYLILPAYNEQNAIGDLIQEARSILEKKDRPFSILLIDDGSTDGTAETGRLYLRQDLDFIIQHSQNMGLGQAMKSAFLFLKDRINDQDIAISMDADLTHLPAQIPQLEELILKGFDMVVCSRFQNGARTIGVPLWRTVGSWCLNRLLSLAFNTSVIRDFSTNYRAYNCHAIKALIKELEAGNIKASGFGFVAEIIIRLRQHNLRMSEIPIILRYDRKQDLSKMRILKTLIEYGRIYLEERKNKNRSINLNK